MTYKVEFTKDDTLNGVSYKKGDSLKVSDGTYTLLNERKTVKDFVAKKTKKEK